MSKRILALFLLALLGAGGCTSDSMMDDSPGGDDDAPPFTNGVSTLSGAAEPGFVDGRRGKARFHNPVNVAYGLDGMLYVSDFDNGKVRAVDPNDGTTSTVVAQQGFARPFAIAFAADGTMYVSTDRNPQGQQSLMSGTIWRVDIGAKEATPLAANIGRPRGMAVLPTGQIVFADYMHHVVQVLDPSTGAVVPLAGAWDAKGMADGAGTAVKFATPYGVAIVNGKIVVADFENHRLRQVGLDGKVTTFAGAGAAGFADGAVAGAKFNKPQGLAADADGNLYVSDLDNYRIRKISSGLVETIAGSGMGGFADSDDRLAAQLYGLEGLSVTPDGAKVFAADGGRGEEVPFNRVRVIKMR